jgi:hypothetical protein
MTPEEIVNNIVNNVVSEDYTISAIEAIKQYAKQMCDKQKMQCQINWAKVPNNDEISNGLAIYNAPYPKELQD